MEQNILIIEDEKKIAELLRDYLQNAGYGTHEVDHGDLAIAAVKKINPDLILLDIMLPGIDGIEICKQVRTFSEVPIIMISAKVEEIDRLIGLEIGADDYVCKPFSPREVVARVKSVLRRIKPAQTSSMIQSGPIQLNEETHQVTIKDHELRLTPIEFNLLKILISKPEKVFSRAELLSRVQGYDFDGYDRVVDTHIKNLRKKLAKHLPDQEIIQSIYGVGYRYSEGKIS